MNRKSMFVSVKLRAVLLSMMIAGILLYLYGVIYGFSQIFGEYQTIELTPSATFPITFTYVPSFFFESYPRFTISNYLSAWYFDSRIISPLGIIFLIFAVLAIVLLLLGRPNWMLVCSIVAYLTVLVQYVILGNVVGSVFLGYGSIVLSYGAGFPPLNLVTFFFNSCYLLILPALLFEIVAIAYVFHYLWSKRIELIGELKSPSANHFITLQESGRIFAYGGLTYQFSCFVYFVFSLFSSKSIYALEFPLLSGYTPPFSSYIAPLYWISFLFILSLFVIVMLPMAFVIRRFTNRLIQASLPIFAEKIEAAKSPILLIADLQKALGLTAINKNVLKNILTRMIKPADKEGILYFDSIKNFVYLKKPMADLLKEEREKSDSTYIQEIASKLGVKPKIVKNIYRRLIYEKILTTHVRG